MALSDAFLSYFEGIEDPRAPGRNHRHKLEDLLAITLLAVSCGADNWVEVSQFGQSRQEWLQTFLELPNGIPSHDTFGRVFGLLDANAFERSFSEWARSLSSLLKDTTQTEIIAIDGKTSRASANRKQGQSPLHLVSAWASEQGLVLAQLSTLEKSNEIEAIPRLLKMIDLDNSIVTTDAMGCQRAIATDIRRQKADYILALKGNHPSLSRIVRSAITVAERKTFAGTPYLRQIEKVRAHGRLETRRYTLLSCDNHFLAEAQWPGLCSIGMLEVKRTVNHETTRSVRYFLTSLAYNQMKDFMRGVRQHWHIEINLHWSLDVSFDDDRNRARTGHAQENLSIIKRIALNLLNQDRTTQLGIKAKRKKAAWDNQYLQTILAS